MNEKEIIKAERFQSITVFRCLASVAGAVIQATGRKELEDGMSREAV